MSGSWSCLLVDGTVESILAEQRSLDPAHPVHPRTADTPRLARDLTPQALQVAHLLASGRTTRQAAAALFLSPKTVEFHLRHVYTKLGISSRTELADVLASLGGLDACHPPTA
ncbi:MAG: response regulator transcription factor [Actinomycetes bacterium]